ncbi:hypothetical protein [Amycolatopsis sp. FDAARGOS 1241]|uniref:DUF6895 family protein n=1 Tax=Amycolatopsis sp. FDAARGOS 1241 TaxID=2778070 RepID=UPI00195142EC|nr:hypothetical protein [Amycolatopsis sp. FDAARGOS 1241]QRP46927.1 hypothetical protein I6J71_02420 [Amycolatopsis sp. FDAARGOS 1241]
MTSRDWLEAHLEWFAPALWNEFLPARPFGGGPLLELLILCDEVPGLAVTGPALELADRLTAAPEFRAGLYRGDAYFTYHVWLLVLMDRLGARRPELLAAAQGLLDAGVRPNQDGIGALELRYVTDLGGLANPHLPSARRLYDRWREGQHLDPFRMTDADCYALTHAVFYGTAFGRTTIPPDPALTGATRLMLAAHLARGDLDLGAELFHTALLTGASSEPARQRLATAARDGGAVAGPLHDPAVAARLTGRKADAYEFGTCYHTTLVTELALAAPVSGEPMPEPGPIEDLVLAFRRGDLSRTATLLSGVAYEGRRDPAVVAAGRHLRAQRQPDGSFGIPPDAERTALCEVALERFDVAGGAVRDEPSAVVDGVDGLGGLGAPTKAGSS